MNFTAGQIADQLNGTIVGDRDVDIIMISKKHITYLWWVFAFYYNTFSQKINYLDYHGILIAPFIPDKTQQWK